MESNEPIIGIDLGTTFSCVSIIRQDQVEIIQDTNTGKRPIPSMVSFKHDNECLVGWPAKKNMLQYPKATMYDSKRLLGHKFNNKHVQEDIKNWPVKVIEDEETKKPKYVIKIGNEEREYLPEDVASIILNYLKTFAETFENKEIEKAVITVPANFNSLQRQATIDAAEEAGLEVVKIINEPTAAAIAYGHIRTNDSSKEWKLLIFDLGGGTFDVTILNIKGLDYYVLASLGEEHLGGEDFNKRLIDYVMGEIKKDDKFKNIDMSKKDDEKTINFLKKLNSEIEIKKIELSCQNKTSILLESIFGIDDFNIDIDRTKYEELCKDLWEKCLIKVDEALKKAKLKKDDIDDIILIGGSTRTPKIKQMVQEYFNGKEPLQDINPDEVVAYGAILSAKIDLKIHDKTSKAIGISIGQKNMDVFIPVGTNLPFIGQNVLQYSKSYSLDKVNKDVKIKIYEGNNEKSIDNFLLYDFVVKLDKDNKGKKLEIKMRLNHNSILKVEAIVKEGNNIISKMEVKFEKKTNNKNNNNNKKNIKK